MKKALLSLMAGMILSLPAAPAFAGAQEGIAAIVNDSVITYTDIRDRTDLYLSGTQTAPPPEARKKMEQQVLSRLIDEALQLQEAKKLGIVVGEADLTAGFADLSRQNRLTPEEFKKQLKGAGIQVDSLYDQIRASIAWSHVVRRKLRPQVNISETEIDLTMTQISSNAGKMQYHVAEIFLIISAPEKEEAVRIDAEKLVQQLTGGASFSTVAREFSQAPGAKAGGDLGWVQEGQLDPALDTALKQMKPGQVSPPIRSAKGYHVLFLRNMRQNGTQSAEAEAPEQESAAAEPLIALKQIIIPFTEKDPSSVIAAKMKRGETLKAEIKDCAAMDARMKDFPADGTGDMGRGPQSALPPALRAIVEKLEVNQLSSPIRTPAGWAVLMVCAREKPPEKSAKATPAKFSLDSETSRESVANKIGLQRLNQMADRYLRDIRATAFIDKRI